METVTRGYIGTTIRVHSFIELQERQRELERRRRQRKVATDSSGFAPLLIQGFEAQEFAGVGRIHNKV